MNHACSKHNNNNHKTARRDSTTHSPTTYSHSRHTNTQRDNSAPPTPTAITPSNSRNYSNHHNMTHAPRLSHDLRREIITARRLCVSPAIVIIVIRIVIRKIAKKKRAILPHPRCS